MNLAIINAPIMIYPLLFDVIRNICPNAIHESGLKARLWMEFVEQKITISYKPRKMMTVMFINNLCMTFWRFYMFIILCLEYAMGYVLRQLGLGSCRYIISYSIANSILYLIYRMLNVKDWIWNNLDSYYNYFQRNRIKQLPYPKNAKTLYEMSKTYNRFMQMR